MRSRGVVDDGAVGEVVDGEPWVRSLMGAVSEVVQGAEPLMAQDVSRSLMGRKRRGWLF